jgi:5-methylcytosine-specific restriction endonuclease McrA
MRFNPNDPYELAAARMTRFLNSKPRHAKTRAYLATLPKRGYVVVKPEDYPRPITREEARLSAALSEMRDKQRYAAWEARGKPPSPSAPRKDRRRPRAEAAAITLPLRVRLYDAQEGKCGLCGAAIHEISSGTLDHVVPRALGGQNVNNLLLAHASCNNWKANRAPTKAELQMLAFVNARLASCDSDGNP